MAFTCASCAEETPGSAANLSIEVSRFERAIRAACRVRSRSLADAEAGSSSLQVIDTNDLRYASSSAANKSGSRFRSHVGHTA